ncbi:MAG: Uma2 family endonuclease [Saprospiraceae bacterium]
MTSTSLHTTVEADTGKHAVSLERYFEIEAGSVEKIEFHKGKIVPMAGGTFIHNTLAQRAARLIDNFIEAESLNYFVSNSDTKIMISDERVVFPDAVVIAEQPVYYQKRKDIITNPLLVVEVLSPSTEEYDKISKFGLYRTLPSFREYVLVYQDKVQATVYTRIDSTTWVMRDYVGMDTQPILYALHECPLSFSKLYRGLHVGL